MSLEVTTTAIRWVDARTELPDDEMTVLVALADGEVWTGFHEDGAWHYVSAETISGEVTHWAEFPPPPPKPPQTPESAKNERTS